MTSPDIRAAQSTLNDRVLGKPGVEGTAIGQHRGSPCLKVYISDSKAKSVIPSKVAGYPVVVETTGRFGKL
ncbi:MAG: hypothetical protein R3253_05580 [Longimicrobiales bacterium]|nr:hypothetical protein [Longimicrobiales bacterium]